MADLRTNYQDDVLDASKNTARVYDLVDSNGTVVLAGVHLEDKTVYTTEGDDYGAADINTQNGKINELSNDLSAKKYFINTSTIISNIQSDTDWVNATRTITYTATQNCSINGQTATKLAGNIEIRINDVIVSRITADSGAIYAPCNFLLQSGDTIKFNAIANTYFDINAFGLK